MPFSNKNWILFLALLVSSEIHRARAVAGEQNDQQSAQVCGELIIGYSIHRFAFANTSQLKHPTKPRPAFGYNLQHAQFIIIIIIIIIIVVVEHTNKDVNGK